MRFSKGQVLFDHEFHHEEQVPLRVVRPVAQEAGALRLGELLAQHCLANERTQTGHLFCHQLLRETAIAQCILIFRQGFTKYIGRGRNV